MLVALSWDYWVLLVHKFCACFLLVSWDSNKLTSMCVKTCCPLYFTSYLVSELLIFMFFHPQIELMLLYFYYYAELILFLQQLVVPTRGLRERYHAIISVASLWKAWSILRSCITHTSCLSNLSLSLPLKILFFYGYSILKQKHSSFLTWEMLHPAWEILLDSLGLD